MSLVASDYEPISVLLVETLSMVRAAIKRLLDDAEQIHLVFEAGDCDEAIRLARRERPHIVIMDMHGPCIAVLNGSHKLRRQCPDVKIIAMNANPELHIPQHLIRAGAAGCLSRDSSEQDLLDAIQRVHRGDRYISEDLAKQIAEQRFPDGQTSPFEGLSHRELQILLLLTQGKAVQEIAADLCVTPKTINRYRCQLLDKLGARTEVQLMHMALRHGMIDIAHFS
jgi:two-component system, NarL family, invasion response regulator UvrY